MGPEGSMFLSGSIKLKGDHGNRFVTLYKFLQENKPDVIIYEEVRRFMSSAAAYIFCGLRAAMLMYAHQHKIPVNGVAVTSIKKFWTGSGKASKMDMIDETVKRTGILPNDDNEADAIAMWHYHWSLNE